MTAIAQTPSFEEIAATWESFVAYVAGDELSITREQFEAVPLDERATARRLAPWAAVICKCDGGYMAFESAEDAARWKSQK